MNKIKILTSILKLCLLTTTLLWNSVMAQENKNCNTPEYRQFDFWIGEWVVKDSKGNIQGYNKIFSILDGCALSENWHSVSGNPGVSYNFYDKTKGQWHQTWVDNSGGTLYLDGGLKDGVMVLSSANSSNQKVIQQISWTPLDDGSVKQHWQSSKDGGKNWTDVFLGFYHKKE